VGRGRCYGAAVRQAQGGRQLRLSLRRADGRGWCRGAEVAAEDSRSQEVTVIAACGFPAELDGQRASVANSRCRLISFHTHAVFAAVPVDLATWPGSDGCSRRALLELSLTDLSGSLVDKEIGNAPA